jgi:hypothetical protein
MCDMKYGLWWYRVRGGVRDDKVGYSIPNSPQYRFCLLYAIVLCCARLWNCTFLDKCAP